MAGEQEANFMAITGASETAARRVLEMCGGDFEQSIMLWYADEELQRSLSAPDATAAASSSTAARASSGQSRQARRQAARRAGREDENGVIHIDSDDEDDVTMTEVEDDFSDDDAENVARRAQEEEDAAVAQRLQEELYGNQANVDDDGVRAPMARTTETLVEPGYGGYDDAQDAMLEQLRRRQRAQARGNNPFARSVWDDPTRPSAGPASAGGQSNLSSRLAEMFRPPHELISHFTVEEARDEGKAEKKWIMVNLQDMSDFNCQALNRDIWKNESIADLIRENFIFLQYEKDHPLSEDFIIRYFPDRRHENPDTYPYVAIIDPRTGSKEKEWSGIPFPSASDFLIALTEFLDRYSLDPKKKNPVSTEKRKPVVDVDRMTEEEMLELAMKNSLAAANGNASAGGSSLVDFEDASSSDKGKDKVVSVDEESPEPATATSEPSEFQKIASDRPHVEPPHDPSKTTRLQVRNPPARIIRRFLLDEPVRRIYEWLKAEPLAGKEGVEFELKSMPQGVDLINQLDMTIKEAGLANGTVMIEFMEEEA
ncbi:hypothetical protein V8F20_005438 [Naviculisporaceae sp. PSN 640]